MSRRFGLNPTSLYSNSKGRLLRKDSIKDTYVLAPSYCVPQIVNVSVHKAKRFPPVSLSLHRSPPSKDIWTNHTQMKTPTITHLKCIIMITRKSTSTVSSRQIRILNPKRDLHYPITETYVEIPTLISVRSSLRQTFHEKTTIIYPESEYMIIACHTYTIECQPTRMRTNLLQSTTQVVQSKSERNYQRKQPNIHNTVERSRNLDEQRLTHTD